MLGSTAQTWIAIAMVVAAAAYLSRNLYRFYKGKPSKGACCDSGTCHTSTPPAEDDTKQHFVPSDNLVDLARRHRQKRDASNGSHSS